MKRRSRLLVLVKSLYFLGFLSVFAPLFAHADRVEIRRPFGAFKIELPADFQQLPDSTNSALLLAIKRGAPFPSFNVIGVAAPYDLSMPISTQKERVLESYRSVGLTSAALVSGESIALPSAAAMQTVIRYQNQDKTFLSQITIVPFADRHFVLTYIDREEQFSKDQALAITSSFMIEDQLRPTPTVSTKVLPNPGITGGLLLGLLLIAAFVTLFLRRRNNV